MRPYSNSWLYGETSQKLAGRFDTEIYSNGCSRLVNMYAHRQGGVSRRWPMRYLCDAYGASRLIPFTPDSANSFIIMLGNGVLKAYRYGDGTLYDLSSALPLSWAGMGETKCREVRYANYYNDLYLVQSDRPLMCISYTGALTSPFTVSTPTLYCNEDITEESIDTDTHLREILGIEDGDHIILKNGFGDDDFKPMGLNREGNYASDIAIVSERMWLLVNGSTKRIFVSRPYNTTQAIDATGNSTIRDFIQYQIVCTRERVMKDEDKISLVPAKYSDGSPWYDGTPVNPQYWLPPSQSTVFTGETLAQYKAANLLTVHMASGSATEIQDIYLGDTKLIEARNAYVEEDEFSTRPVYIKKTATGEYEEAKFADESGTNQALKYIYPLSTDTWVHPDKRYYTSNGTLVANPKGNPSTKGYCEMKAAFNDEWMASHTEYDGSFYSEGRFFFKADGTRLYTKELDYNGMVYAFYTSSDYSGLPYVESVRIYQLDLSNESQIYEDRATLSRIATSSTGMELQLATGRNDENTWIALGDYIMIGNGSSEWRLDTSINALDGSADLYSSYGSPKGLVTSIGTELVFLERGNGLRMVYRDYYGLQNLELTLTNPEIMEGTVHELHAIVKPEPMVLALKDDSVVCLTLDRQNGVQAFSRWTFGMEVKSIGIAEDSNSQIIAMLVSDGTHEYLAELDDSTDEYLDFRMTASGAVNDVEYESYLTANAYDTNAQDGTTLNRTKNVDRIVFRALSTGRVITEYNGKDINTTRSGVSPEENGHFTGLGDHEININGGTVRDLMITVKAFRGQPMNLLAMMYSTRII